MQKVKDFLEKHKIKYITHKHPAVFTCEESDQHCQNIPGLSCKNLFLKNKKSRRLFLIVSPAHKQSNLKKFGEQVGDKKISFASSEKLKEVLDLEPGSVSPFGLINDKEKIVEVYVDREVYKSEIVGFHPNKNTETLELSKKMFHKYLETIEHEINVIDL